MKKLLVILVMLVAVNASGQWQPDFRMTNDTIESFTSYNNAWCVGASGDSVHIVWTDYRSSDGEIYYKRSTNGGANWGAEIRLTYEFSGAESPSIVVTGPVVRVVYIGQYRDVYYKQSTNGGTSWGNSTRLTYNISSASNPSMSVSGSNIHIVWADVHYGDLEISYIHSTNGGLNWGNEMRLTDATGHALSPSVSAVGAFVQVVWYDDRSNSWYVYHRRSTNNGVDWQPENRLTDDPSYAAGPSVAVSGSVVHVVWYDIRNNRYDIFYRRSTNYGLTWGSEVRLNTFNNGALFPNIVASGMLVHVFWEDYRKNNYEIYSKRSTNEGVSWGTDTRVTSTAGYSSKASIAVSGPIVHLIWQEAVSTYIFKPDIYYKRNLTSNSVGINTIGSSLPSKYSLSQNYPNPFNPFTNVKFSILNSGNVKLVVYDIQGGEIQTLVNESLKPGTYETSFDGSAFNSGVYFYKLMTDGFSETKKMLMIK